jgi:hypothetical protein
MKIKFAMSFHDGSKYDAGGVVANSKLPSVAPLALANSHMDEAPLLAN